MFILAQLIGLYVINQNPLSWQQPINGTIVDAPNPYSSWIGSSTPQNQQGFYLFFGQLVFSLLIAIALIFLLMKLNIKYFLKIWFLLVVVVALFLCSLAFLKNFNNIMSVQTASLISISIALVLGFWKVFKKGLIVHNLTELFIYPGIAVVFVNILNIYTMIGLLIIISIYDMWAVWKVGLMQKMAKYQAQNLGFIGGFFIPYLSKKQRTKIKLMDKKQLAKLGKKGMRVNIAILGGGDIVFPIITAGVVYLAFGLIPSLLVTIGAILGLSYLLFRGEGGKSYPAMPFLTVGMFLGMIIAWVLPL